MENIFTTETYITKLAPYRAANPNSKNQVHMIYLLGIIHQKSSEHIMESISGNSFMFIVICKNVKDGWGWGELCPPAPSSSDSPEL